MTLSPCTLYTTLFLTVKTDCDVTFSNHLISQKAASADNTSMALPVPRRTFRVKAHVQMTQCYACHCEIKPDTGARVSCDRMQEDEIVQS